MTQPSEDPTSAGRREDDVTAVRSGDLEALDRLLCRLQAPFIERAGRQLGSELRARTRPSDVLQDAYLEIVRCVHTFRGRTEPEFAAWVGTIIDNAARQQRRRLDARRRRAPQGDGVKGALADSIPSKGRAPSSHAYGAEQLERYTRTLEELPASYRYVIEQIVLSDRSIDDVAKELGRTVGAVRTTLSRARSTLALRLAQFDGDGPRATNDRRGR